MLYKWIIQTCALENCCYHCKILWRSVQIVVCINSLFLFWLSSNTWYGCTQGFFVSIYIFLTIHLFERHLDYYEYK